jgi:tRNA threonylcarbamoyladenosine biosynthesis protein TsaB
VTTIAALDTATDDVSVAVTREGEVVDERQIPKPPDVRPRHAEAVLVELEAAVDAAGGWEEIGLMAVGVGPGSFTGLRVGVATARGIAQALGKPVVGVGTLAALARGIAEDPAATGRPRLAVLDARRGQAFAALFNPEGKEEWAPLVAGPDELRERVAALLNAPLAAGSGALRFRGELEAAGAEVLPDEDSAHRVWARHLCRLAEVETPVRPESVQPMYLRPPDAELWLDRDTP